MASHAIPVECGLRARGAYALVWVCVPRVRRARQLKPRPGLPAGAVLSTRRRYPSLRSKLRSSYAETTCWWDGLHRSATSQLCNGIDTVVYDRVNGLVRNRAGG
jgi:hypothetical protein